MTQSPGRGAIIRATVPNSEPIMSHWYCGRIRPTRKPKNYRHAEMWWGRSSHEYDIAFNLVWPVFKAKVEIRVNDVTPRRGALKFTKQMPDYLGHTYPLCNGLSGDCESNHKSYSNCRQCLSGLGTTVSCRLSVISHILV